MRESKSGSQDRDYELSLRFYVMVLTQRLLESSLKKWVESLEDDMS